VELHLFDGMFFFLLDLFLGESLLISSLKLPICCYGCVLDLSLSTDEWESGRWYLCQFSYLGFARVPNNHETLFCLTYWVSEEGMADAFVANQENKSL
jgi:hypothetical protein